MTMEFIKQVISNCLPSSKSVQESIGLKLTEIGQVPEDWPLSTFGSICSAIGDGIHSTPIFNSNGEYYFVNGNNLVQGRVTLSYDTKKADNVEFNKHQKPLGDRTILISINGTIGNIAIYRSEKIILGKSAAYLNIKSNVDKGYIFHCLNSDATQKAFNNGLTGSTIKNLGLGTIRNTVLPLPPIQEQTAIANALSDVDALIQELEKLIAKKQAIKTATMQQLLTGRTRLPQFAHHPDGRKKGYKPSELGEIPEDWEVLGFGSLYQPSITKKSIKQNCQVTFVGMQDVTEQAQLVGQHVVSVEKVKSGFTYFERGDVLVAKITPCFENGKGCHTESLQTEIGYGSTEFHVLRTTDNSDSMFVYYWTTRDNFRNALESEMVGSAGHRRVPLAAIANYQIPVPPKSEQTAIATILSDMDGEIQSLDQRLNKTRQIKQGMMQELLTGKTRLVKPVGLA